MIIIERLAVASNPRPAGFRRLFSEEDAVSGEAALNASRDFERTLDRSRLGSFALDREVFIAAQARERMDYEQVNLKSRAGWVVDDQMDLVQDRLGQRMMYVEDYIPLRSEVMFWWDLLDPNREHVGKTVDIWMESPEIADAIARLHKVYENPDKHDFYRSDVWDNAVIAHCIEHDIDPAMAGSLTYH